MGETITLRDYHSIYEAFCTNLTAVEETTDVVITLPSYETFVKILGEHMAGRSVLGILQPGCSEESHELCRFGFVCNEKFFDQKYAQEQVDKILLAMRIAKSPDLEEYGVKDVFEMAFGDMAYDMFIAEIADIIPTEIIKDSPSMLCNDVTLWE